MPSPGPPEIAGGLEWCSINRCGHGPGRVVVIDPNSVPAADQGGREGVLQECMALDDEALAWVCHSLLVERAGVMDKVMQAWSKQAMLVEEMLVKERDQMMMLEDDSNGDSSNLPGLDYSFDIALPADNVAVYKASKQDESGIPEKPIKADVPEQHMSASDEAQVNYLHELFAARDKKNHGEPPALDIPRIQVWTTMSYCSESEPTTEIAFVRIGDVSKRSVACYQTKDISAKAGEKYVAASGKLVFEAGERMTSLTITTLNDSSWQATLEFEVYLKPQGLENAVLSEALSVCRIKIIDDDCFPTNKFQQDIMTGRHENVNTHTPLLMLEYFKMNCLNPVVRRGLIRTVLADQVENCYFILCLFLNLWMVDYVLCETCDKDQVSSNLTWIVLLRVLPFGLVHWLKFRAVYWKIGGTSRMTLQANLLRKYLNYDEGSLAQVDESKLLMAMTRDAFDLVHNAFCMIPKLISALLRLGMLILYQYCTPLLLGLNTGTVGENIVRLAPALIFPLVMSIFLYIRNPTTVAALEKQKKLQNEMMFHTKHTIQCFGLIRDFRKRGFYVDQFVTKIKAFNSAYTAASAIIVNNNKFASWCSLLVVAAYTQLGGMGCANGKEEVGSFLNTLAIYSALGELWGQVYEVLLDMQNSFEALSTMVQYMNLPTELLHRKKHYDSNNVMLCESFRAALKEERWASCDPVDKICIELRDLSFIYRSKGLITGGLKSSSAELVQGGLYTLVGPPSQGKGTILKLLGQVLIPFYPEHTRNSQGGGGGDLMTPSHLSMLHVSKDPCFVQGSLFYNLTFGCDDSNNSRMERVVGICRKLGMAEHIIETVKDKEMTDCDWINMLSSTELALLHVARALVANPEVLCIHKPAIFLNTEMSDTMYSVLKEFVTSRGLEEPTEEFYQRRPRTCIVSARRVVGPAAECADAVYHIDDAEGMVLVKDHRGFQGSTSMHEFHCELP